jgi:hypothetical protein
MRTVLLSLCLFVVAIAGISTEEIFYTVKKRTRPMYMNFYQEDLKPGEKIQPAFEGHTHYFLPEGGACLGLGYFHTFSSYEAIFEVDADAVYIEGSGNFDRSLWAYRGRDVDEFNYTGWIPSYYFEALDSGNPKDIFKYEPYLERVKDPPWPTAFHKPTFFRFHDLAVFIEHAMLFPMNAFYITHLDNLGNGLYRADIIAGINAEDGIVATGVEDLVNGESYVIYIHHAGNRLRIYFDNNENPKWDLVKVPAQFTKNMMNFPRLGRWPGDKHYKSYLAPNIFEPWPALALSEIKNIIEKKPIETFSHRVSSNLRLRGAAGTSAKTITTLAEGTGVYVLKTGDTATIDGIIAPWVYVVAQDGKRGWCFSGYLEEIQKEPEALPASALPPEAAPETEESGGAVPYAALIGGGAAAIALAGVFILLALRRKEKT